jgi:hypothetical protein
MTFSVPPNQNYHLMTSCMAHVSSAMLSCPSPSSTSVRVVACVAAVSGVASRGGGETDDHSSDGEESGPDDCVGTKYCKFCERPQTGEGSSGESGTRGGRGLVPEMRA